MAVLQLLVALVVLVPSNGGLWNGKVLCHFEQRGNICFHTRMALIENVDAIRELDNNTFMNNIKRLSNTNSAIMEVLTEENETKLFERLHKPMHREFNALSQLMASCIDETGKELSQCGDALPAVSQATLNLAKATMEVADGRQKEAIKKACDKFMEDFRTEYLNKTVFELAHELGTTVLDAI